MTIQILLQEEIRSHVLKILSGACMFQRNKSYPKLYILSPWISDVVIELDDIRSLREERAIEWFILDYNIKSINLPYALLLLKLHEGVDVNIVTLPPDETNYHNYASRARDLLEFLDEIGCEIFINSRLHSKLLLANDLALLGSFNLSSSALYYREEIGVSIDDLENLDKLEDYCLDVISDSKPYGYTSLANQEIAQDSKGPDYVDGMSLEEYNKLLSQWSKIRKEKGFYIPPRITRGWLLDQMINDVFLTGESRTDRYGEFFDVVGGYDKFVKSYARDLNVLYLLSLRRLISEDEKKERTFFSLDKKEKVRFVEESYVEHFLGYNGDKSIDAIMEFINDRFARKKFPDVRLKVESLQ